MLDSYRSRLTGLTESEVRALFMLSIPAPLADLGVDDELRTAMRKLSASLPDRNRAAEAQVRQRVHVDSVWWAQGDDPVPHLRLLHEAVWQDRVVRIRYRQPYGTPSVLERSVDPYGLVVKAGAWYLVYARLRRLRAIQVSHLMDVEYPPSRWNVYPFHFSDGEDWEAARTVASLTAVLDRGVAAFGYGEIQNDYTGSVLMQALYEELGLREVEHEGYAHYEAEWKETPVLG
ncbi:MAG: DUF444 family protein, partial [Anaerolineae bacterium]